MAAQSYITGWFEQDWDLTISIEKLMCYIYMYDMDIWYLFCMMLQPVLPSMGLPVDMDI